MFTESLLAIVQFVSLIAYHLKNYPHNILTFDDMILVFCIIWNKLIPYDMAASSEATVQTCH